MIMYSLDYIKRAVGYKDERHSFKELKEAFNISPVTYYDWKKKLKKRYYENKQKQKRKRKIDNELLIKAVEEKPDSFLRELAALFDCSPQAIFYALEKLGFTYKKNFYISRKK